MTTAAEREPVLHERLRQLAERVGKCKTVEQAMVAVLVMADCEEHRWNDGLKALIGDLNAIEEQGGWVGGFAPDQWAEIETAIREVYKPHIQPQTPDELVDAVKARLMEKEATAP